MSLDSADVAASGAGFRVRTQRDRGLFYQNLCLGMRGNPNCVGWHWFKYSVRAFLLPPSAVWARQGSNLRPKDYESSALTN